MSSEKLTLVVIYIIIPLVVLTTFLSLLMNMQQQEMSTQYQQNVLLYPRVIQRDMGLMTPCSSAESVYKDYEAVKAVLEEIPDAYIDDNTAVGTSATITKLKTFLGSATDRTHVAAHGEWDSTPVVLLNGDLKKSVVDQWSSVGYRCKLLVLSACNSMGHDGTQSNVLASAIMIKSGVQQVAGYKDLVDAGGAALFASLFWAAHLWQNEAAGGVSSDDAYSQARDGIHEIMLDQLLQIAWASFILQTIVAIILAILSIFIPPFAIVAVALAIIIGMYSQHSYQDFRDAMDSAYLNVVKYGSNVAGLTYSDGGGGGGDLPF